MPTYQITAPDGSKYKVTAPEGATQDEILQRVQAQSDPSSSGYVYDVPEPSPMERVGRGFADVYQGAKQKYLNWTDPEAAQEYTEEKNREIELYERGRGEDAGTDWLRIGGSAAPFMAFPAGGTGLLARGALGAAAGGSAGYSLYSQDNDPASNLIRGGVGAASGGLLNAAGPPLIRGGTRAVQAGKNALSSALRRGPSDDVVREALRGQGVDLSKMSKQIQQKVLADAKEQLKVSGRLSPEQLARRADIEAVSGPGSATTGQVTRNPSAWTQERNLQRTEVNMPAVQRGATDTLTQRYQQQSQAAERYAQNLADDLSGAPASRRPGTNLQASERAIRVIQQQDEAADDAVRNLYDQYRQAGVDAAVPDVRIADELGRVSDDVGVENIPPAVLNRLKEFGFLGGERTKLLTVNEADKLNRLINNNNPGHGPQSLALGRLKKVINESLLDIPEDQAAGSKALLTARKAAADRFAAQRAGKGVEQAIKDTPPDRFFERNVLGGSVRDLEQLKQTLAQSDDGLQAWNTLRARAWESVIDDATQQGRKALDGTRLDRAINKIGEDRLKVLFTPDELSKIDQLRRGVTAMTVEPDFTGVNYSNTTPAAMGMLARSTGIPGLGMVTDPMERSMQRAAAENAMAAALRGQGANTMARDAAQQQTRNRLADILATQRSAYTGPLVPAYMEQANDR